MKLPDNRLVPLKDYKIAKTYVVPMPGFFVEGGSGQFTFLRCFGNLYFRGS